MKFASLKWLAALPPIFTFAATAQTLDITNGIYSFDTLSNTTVTMTGHSELWITGTNNPFSGSVINLNSSGAWFFLPNIRPSSALGYLGQIKVNGAAAVSGDNVRVDEYVMGAVIIPHSPSFTPLQIFSAPNFLGASNQLSLYTYYTNNALGIFNRNIGSFKLKRGYMATFAQNADGTGASKVFIAQDSDIEVSLLDASLNEPVSFVRVFPWHWIARRGWADTAGAGGEGAAVKPYWFYDWGNGRNSSTDAEYAPMQWGAGYSAGINGKQKSTALLGFNEPDSSVQANMSVASAIANWPALMQSGLRAGAPAVSDSGVSGEGLDWLYSFMDQANSLGYRVDFIPIHFYKCGWSATQLSNYLAGIYQTTGKPIWVTEFNNGANWCSGDPPTPAQEASKISQFLNVLENAPFVERYSIYNWVGTNRAMVLDDGTVTPAGVIYRDRPSNMAYTQTLPSGGSRGIAQFHFENDTLDSSGYGNNGFAVGIPGYTNGPNGKAISLDGANSFVQLPPTIPNGSNFTFVAWVRWNGGASWQRIFDFGNDTSHYMFLTPSSSAGTLRFGIRNGGSEQIVETAGLPAGQWVQVAVTINGTIANIYTNGTLAASGGITINPSDFNPAKNYLGKSQFPADPLFNGNLDEVQIADYTFTPAQIAALQTDRPPQFAASLFDGGIAAPLQNYTANIENSATDPDAADTVTYSKASGPTWLTVNASGSIAGAPGAGDGGTNYFTIRATDSAGASAFAVLAIYVPIIYANGTWEADADGNWSDMNNWSGGIIANGAGFTADFSTLNISANRTVMMDGDRSVGALKFGDTSGAQNWFLNSDDDTLTLDSGSTSIPSIAVNQNTATISTPLAGDNGFAKTGAGTLTLSGDNSISGTIYLDRNSNTANDGTTRAANPNALSQISNIQIRNNNSGRSTLQLDGSNGGVNSPAVISLAGRNVNVPAIENISGSNTLSGGVSINVGGGYYILQSDAGTLNLGGIITSAASGNRTFTFQGGGNFYVSGSIQNGAATNAIIKTGSSTLTLAGTSFYSGGTTINGGSLLVNGATGPGSVTVANSGTLGGNGTIRGAVTVQPGGKIAPGSATSFGALTVANTFTLQPDSTVWIKISQAPLTNDLLKIAGSQLTYGGTLTVTNLSGTLASGDSFQLFSAGNYSGSFSNTNLPPLSAGLAWNFNSSAGILSVIQKVMATPTNLNLSISNNTLTLSWPADHIGWHLQAQTNSLDTGLSTNWMDVPNSALTNQMSFPLDGLGYSMFYRMILP